MVRLKEICKVDWGNTNLTKAAYTEGGEYLGVSATGCDGKFNYYDFEAYTPVISAIGANCGKMFLPQRKFVAIKNTITLVPHDCIDGKYLYYAMINNRIPKRGGGQPFISKSDTENYEIPCPSLSIQREIVRIFDILSSIIKSRQQQLQKLDELVKFRFVEMFGDPISNPMKWDIYRLEECLVRIDNGKSFICSDKPRNGDYPAILKLSAATYGDYRPNENKALLDESLFIESSEVHAGDLLFTRKNTPELVGMAAYVQNTPPKLMMPDLIFRLVPNEKVNAAFLWQLINCKEFRPVIQAISGGSAKSMSNISKERLGQIKVICPPRELQDSLIPFVEQIDKSKVAVQKALDEAQLLFDSLMQKYFG